MFHAAAAPAKLRKRSGYDEYRIDPNVAPDTDWHADMPPAAIWGGRNVEVGAGWSSLTGEERGQYHARAREVNLKRMSESEQNSEDPHLARAR